MTRNPDFKYERTEAGYNVYMSGRKIGVIQKSMDDYYRYVPKGGARHAGEWFSSLEYLQGTLEDPCDGYETPKKVKPPTKTQYRDAKISLAISAAPTIHPCRQCEWPVLKGYCCETCGSKHPNG